MSTPTSRILLLQLKRIGDTVLTSPAMAAVRAAYPAGELLLVVNGAPSDLAPAFEAVDEVWNYRPGRLNAGIWQRLVTGKFDGCLDFTGTDRSALMARLSGARVRAGYRKFAEAKPLRRKAFTTLSDASVRELHAVDFHLALADALVGNLDRQVASSGFRVPDSVKVAAGLIDSDRFVLVHPGAARSEKYWPAERWAVVIDHISTVHGQRCVVTGSNDPEERSHVEEIGRRCVTGFVNLAEKLSLLELAKVIGQSTLALGVDSAAMHLAAMQGCHQIVLFGPTNPYHWRPRHENASVLLAGDNSLSVSEFEPRHQAAPMTDLSTEVACRAIDARLSAACPPS
jgi:ADP-heptose:LPS heptosyltransferase